MAVNDGTHRPVVMWAGLLLAALVAACGGAGGVTTTPGARASLAAGSTQGAAGASIAPAVTTAAVGAVKRSGGGEIQACALLTAAQIQDAIGTVVTEAVNYADKECRWTVEPLDAFPGSQGAWLDVQFEKDQVMTFIENDPGTEGVLPVNGLGDRAFLTNVNRQLWVQHGTDAFVVRSRLRSLSDDTLKSRDAEEAIRILMARLVLAQL
jgi:hypothetical protein